MNPTSAGWYPDPQDSSKERWFDGQQWSQEHVRSAAGQEQPADATTTPPPPPTEQGQGQQGYGTPYPQAPPVYGGPGAYPQPPDNSGKIMGIIGIVCGVVAFLFCPPGFGIAGIVLGVLAINKQHKTLGIAAIVVSAIGLIVGLIIGAIVGSHVYQ